MAPAYKKVQEAGIKLVLMDNVPDGLKHPQDYSSMISADSQGNGQAAAEILANQIPKNGTVGIIDFGVDFFVTNQRTLGVTNWLTKNRPDIKVKASTFTDTSKVSQTAGDFLTANPDVKGLFAVWDAPAMDTLSAMRAQGINIPVTTIDLGLEAALEIASGGPLKGLGAQRPYDQGVAEAMALMNAMIGNETPAWVGVKSLAVIQSNLLESYREVWKTDAPKEVTDACKKAGNACG
jgi:ribose transport system substrate-binding protein